MILHFSGTGNSAYVAKKIGEQIGEPVVSINGYLKRKKLFSDTECEKLVFVTPTYAWRIPKVVEQWILRSTFAKDAKAYFILTCGGGIGKAGAYAESLCQSKPFAYMGCAQVVMPENYIAMFSAPDEEEAKEIIERALPQISELAKQIGEGEPLQEKAPGFADSLLSGFVNTMFYPVAIHAKKFTADERCVSCGKCAKVCPLNNVKLKDGKPQWGDVCTHCMACITSCPKEAIEYGKKSVGQPRYRCPYEKEGSGSAAGAGQKPGSAQ